MSETSKKVNTSLFNSPMETFPGLTIDDLNRYLPALQTINDIHMDSNNMKEGMFLTKCLDGLKKLPDEISFFAIALIVTAKVCIPAFPPIEATMGIKTARATTFSISS